MGHRLFLIGGTLVLLFGLFFLYLVYAIGISGNTDQRPEAFLIIVAGLVLIAIGLWLWLSAKRR